MFTIVKDLIKDESGATAIKYGLIAALVSVAGVVALTNNGYVVAEHVYVCVDDTQRCRGAARTVRRRFKACHRSGEREAWWAWGARS
jgi:Flp pilus assembly pilin Flp